MSPKNYFSFGSNMDHAQMKKRTPNAKYIGIGCAQNHDIVFNRIGSYRPGGVASIVKHEGMNTYGVVWQMSQNDFDAMDRFEDPTAYTRTEMDILMQDGSVTPCQVYIAIPQGDVAADQEYLELIINAAISAKLPENWIDRIKQYRL